MTSQAPPTPGGAPGGYKQNMEIRKQSKLLYSIIIIRYACFSLSVDLPVLSLVVFYLPLVCESR